MSLTTTELDWREAVLHQITMSAGEMALDFYRSRRAGEFSLKGRQDFLTEADSLVEIHIREELLKHFPQDGLLGEETGGNTDVGALWVADPIDGTANFARGIDHFCVAVAFVNEGAVELGATFNPVTGEFYSARKGRGATKNGVPLCIAATPAMENASIELGWSPRASDEAYLQMFASILKSGASIRRGASGALALAWVAEGRTDGYVEYHMNAWDCLGGLLMVREAGGRTGPYPANVRDLADGGKIIAAAPGIADVLAQAVQMPLSITQ